MAALDRAAVHVQAPCYLRQCAACCPQRVYFLSLGRWKLVFGALEACAPCGGLFQLTVGTVHAPEACLAASAVVAATADLLVAG